MKVRRGGKVMLPEAVMHSLMIAGVDYPMLFRISAAKSVEKEHTEKIRYIHCGVLEFTSPGNTIVLPDWMVAYLGADDFGNLVVESVSLPLGGYVKLRALEETFLKLHNPKAVLEHNLADFSALTKGVTIEIFHNNQTYHVSVCDIQAQNDDPRADSDGICIIDVDVVLDIDHPTLEDSQHRDSQPSLSFQQVNGSKESTVDSDLLRHGKAHEFMAFSGNGRTVCGSKETS
eukprot:CAMPEP_0201515564 /NCGR_PEP_ID=MMETSP0161_2-20130828/7095_1 /ASSEMBLY_ACC=CAM_ASM_000251 /TAXON_ID=180227 /ORGANISM="Neoparamoeba aestuarina, Strain SoJaBio B1-5/56/2" /LENGTH=230 /DNA_ID=CAMNT_0047912421 /DNA_START=56 /DNA_END=745 /DNA_ORIENTATION=-